MLGQLFQTAQNDTFLQRENKVALSNKAVLGMSAC